MQAIQRENHMDSRFYVSMFCLVLTEFEQKMILSFDALK